MKSKDVEYVCKYNSHYYETITKLKRQLRTKIEKAKEEFSQRDKDLNNYQSSWVDFLIKYDWTSFAVYKEDLLTSNLNEKTIEVNKAIKHINKDLPQEFKLPLQPLKARSLNSLQNYTLKYFKFLIYLKLIDRVIYTFEQDKKKIWHVHALFNLTRNDIYADRIKQYWLLSENSYLEPLEDLRGSLIYISKSFSQLNFNKIKNIENYNFLGNFTQKNNKIIEMKNREYTKEELIKKLNDFKTKHNLHVTVDEKFIENQKRINAKYNAIQQAI